LVQGWLEGQGYYALYPAKENRKQQISYDKALHKQRHKVVSEAGRATRRPNMFGKLKDWRRTVIRYDRCSHTFFSAICIAAVVIHWI